METPLSDAHTHNPARKPSCVRVCDLDCKDWRDAASFAPFCAGIHPGRVAGESLRTLLSELEKTLEAPGAAAVGECGLDRLTETPLALQKEAFEEQAKIAERRALPLVVHCVRAIPEIISLRKSLKARAPWLLHGFRGNAQEAAELTRHGIALSFGPALLKAPPSLQEALKAAPAAMILLETDEADANIKDVFEAAARLRDVSLEELKERTFANFSRIFKLS